MIQREVKLHTGLKIGDARAMTALIREETLADEMSQLDLGQEGLRAHRNIMMRRVVRLGGVEGPTPDLLGRLTRTDWDLIERALLGIDAELAQAAGLLTGGDAAGREEPGGTAPGDA